jgi:hypothetical protein
MQLIVSALRLKLYEIQYLHAATGEVYDPRDQTTGKPFAFPDVKDLSDHHEAHIAPKESEMQQKYAELAKLKSSMISVNRADETLPPAEYDEFRQKMIELHTVILADERIIEHEHKIGAKASMLQLAVMWRNGWSMEFTRSLKHLLSDVSLLREGKRASDAGTAEERGNEDFRHIDWIKCARWYEEWGGDKILQSAADRHTKTTNVMSGLFGNKDEEVSESRAVRKQKKVFEDLSPLMDFLQMLRDALKLHSRMMIARKVKYWDGPRGGQKISDTVYRKFQSFIYQYNECGRSLKAEMQSFPAETVEGFVEPQDMLAETIKIQATAVKRDLEVLLKDAATLRFNYPGSPLCAARLCTAVHVGG